MLHQLTVPAQAAGQRLDVWLESVLEGCTRSLISRLIKAGRCVIAPGVAKAGHFLKGGEQVALEVPEIEAMEAVPEDIPLTLLHEDRHLIAIDKPPGMVVHPAIGHPRGTLVNAVLGRYGSLVTNTDGGSEAWRPGIVHRLDQDTSGVILVARTTAALTFLQDAFKARTVHKRYLAIVAGRPRADFMEHAGWLGRHPRDFRKRAILPDGSEGAKEAYTSVVVLERRSGYSVVEARPKSGRTHQIRVHLAALGHAVLADPTYGRSATWPLVPVDGQAVIRRQALHAWTLDVPHPDGGRLKLQAPIPADLSAWVSPGLTPRPTK